MRRILIASATLLAGALPLATLPLAALAPHAAQAAGENFSGDVQSALQQAKKMLAAHDMKGAMAALDHASSMLSGHADMAAVAARVTQTKQMVSAGDASGAGQMLDSLIADFGHLGSSG